MVYDLFRNFAPEIQVQSYSACSFGHPKYRCKSYSACFFLALESGSLGLKGKK